MKKIIFKNETREMEFNKEFIKKFKPLCIKIIKKTNMTIDVNDEDIQQDLDILIYTAYLNYNSKYCFSTFLYPFVVNYAKNQYNAGKTKKRDNTMYNFISLDSTQNSQSLRGDKVTNLEEIIASNLNVEQRVLGKDLMNFLIDNLTKFEFDLLIIMITGGKYNILCKKYNIKNYTITRKKKTLQDKLKKLLKKYNEVK